MSYLSDAEYVDRHGACCPVCQATDITTGEQSGDNLGRIYQDVRCESCGAEWVDHFHYVGYDELVDPADTP